MMRDEWTLIIKGILNLVYILKNHGQVTATIVYIWTKIINYKN